jgi:hypothetical protein
VKPYQNLALSPAFRETLMQRGLLSIAKPEPVPENPVKAGPKRAQGPRQQSAADLAAKRAKTPPICSKSGCNFPSFHYCEATGFEGDHYGKFCNKHRLEAQERARDYKRRRDDGFRLRIKASQ